MSFDSLNTAVINLNDRLLEFNSLQTSTGCFSNLAKGLKKIAVKSAADKVVKILKSFKPTYETENEIGFESCREHMIGVEAQFHDIESKDGWEQLEPVQNAVNGAITKFLLVFPNTPNYSTFKISQI